MHRTWRAVSAGWLTSTMLLAATGAQAEVLTFQFTGTIQTVDPALASSFAIGQAVSGSFSYDTTTPGLIQASGQVGVYYGAVTSAGLTAGAMQFSGQPPAQPIDYVLVEDDYYNRDGVRMYRSVAGPLVQGLTPTQLYIQLWDPSMTAWTGVALPQSLTMQALGTTYFALSFGTPSRFVTGTFDSLTSPVPEAPVSLMMGVGLAAMAAAYRRRSRRFSD